MPKTLINYLSLFLFFLYEEKKFCNTSAQEFAQIQPLPFFLYYSLIMFAGQFSPGSGMVSEAKITTILIISCVVASTGGFMFGYDIGVTG